MGTGKSKIKYKTYIKKGWVHIYVYDNNTGQYRFSYKYKPGTGISVYANGEVVKD